MIEGLIFTPQKAGEDDLRAAYKGVFGTPAGRMVLADMMEPLRRIPSAGQNADARAFTDGERLAALRIVRMLLPKEDWVQMIVPLGGFASGGVVRAGEIIMTEKKGK